MDFEKVFSLPKCVVPASRALAHTKVKNDRGMYPLGQLAKADRLSSRHNCRPGLHPMRLGVAEFGPIRPSQGGSVLAAN